MVNISYVVEIMQARICEITENIISAALADMSEKGMERPSVDRIILIGEGIAEFSGVNAALHDIVGDTELEVINIGRDIGMKNSYSIATGMLLYISSKLQYGRRPSKIIRESVDTRNEETVKRGKIINNVKGKIKSWWMLFKE